jgi:hypothetical protein
MYTIQHNPARLYNCDKTGITIVLHKHTKILGLKGKRQISSVQFADRGSPVTVVTCFSPTGHFILPLLVFPRKYMKSELMNGSPPGSIHTCHFSGWIESEIFTQLFLYFIDTAWINPRVPFLGVDTERDFHPVVSLFHQTYKADKIRSL